jgi:hypothetical protein
MKREELTAFGAEMTKGAFLGTLGAMIVQQSLGPGILRRDPETARHKELRDALLKGETVEVRTQEDKSPHYSNTDRPYVSVRPNEDPGILAHELGHAEIDRTTIGRVLQSRALRVASAVAGVGGAAMGVLGSNTSHRTIGTLIAVAATAPILGAEGWASSKAVDKLRRAGATEGEVSAAKTRLLKAFGTYATIPASVVGDVATISMLTRHVA